MGLGFSELSVGTSICGFIASSISLSSIISWRDSGAAVSDDASFFTYDTIDDGNMLMPLADGAPASPSLKLTGEQAKQQAKELLQALDASGYEVISVQRGETRHIWGDAEQGWIITCAQTTAGIPIRYASQSASFRLDLNERTGALTDPGTGGAVKPVPILSKGNIFLHYDDNGLRAFLWTNPLQAGDVKNSSVRLMDFGEIKNLFMKNVKELYADKLPVRDLILRVTGVELAYATMPQDDGTFALIPAWVFSGGFEDVHGNVSTADIYDPALMALSATDGTLLGFSYFE